MVTILQLVETNYSPNQLSSSWPTMHLIITDLVVNKKITIALGSCGRGSNIEIIDINSTEGQSPSNPSQATTTST